MKVCKTKVNYILLLSIFLMLSGCVRETITTGIFKEPQPKDLDRAVSMYVQIAYQQLEDKNYERAMSTVRRALDIDDESPQALNALAVVYQHQGDTEKARRSFKKALSVDKKYSQARLNYGQFLYQQGSFKEACEQFEIAVLDDFFTKRAMTYYNLGACYRELGDTVKSEAAFRRCLGLDPNYGAAIGALAGISFDQKKYPEAKKMFDKHVEIIRAAGQVLNAESLWLGIRIERVFGNRDAEQSWALFLKNNYPYSKEYLEYKNSLKN